MSIPKIIHYCWLSNDPVPEKLQKCMSSWNKLEGYKFMLWNFERFDINSSIWVEQAFKAKKYAFAADYIRLYAVYNYGGIYLDMDVEVIKPFDELLDTDIMLAYENDEVLRIEAGCFGAAKGHPFIKKCLDYYKNRPFNPLKLLVIPIIMRNIKQKYFRYADYNIHTRDYFTAKNLTIGTVNVTKNTFAIHHFESSWISNKKENNLWLFYTKYGNDEFLVSFFNSLENKSVNKVSLKVLYKTVIRRTIKRLITQKILVWIREYYIINIRFGI
jgi:mannosyltransferase OCH1-like enzyme